MDMVKVHGATSHPVLNGEIVVIFGPDEEKKGRWLVTGDRIMKAAEQPDAKTGPIISLAEGELTLMLTAEEAEICTKMGGLGM